MIDKLLRPKDVADRLGVSVATLATWRCTHKENIPYVKIGGRVMYREGDVATWVESKIHGVEGASVEGAKV